MKLRILFVFFVCSLMSATMLAEEPKAETVAQQLRSAVVANPDSVLSELDKMEADRHGILPAFQIDLLRALAYNEKRMFSLVERYASRALAADSINAHQKEKLNALTLQSVARSYYGNYQGSMESLLEAIDIARATENTAAEYIS